MRLIDLEPRWWAAHGKRVGIHFRCPNKCGGWIQIPTDPASGYSVQWQATGDTFETLTLKPSIDARHDKNWHARLGSDDPTNPPYLECHWHGFVTNGDITNA